MKRIQRSGESGPVDEKQLCEQKLLTSNDAHTQKGIPDAFDDRVGNVGVSVRSDWFRECGAAFALESGIATLQVRQEEPLSYACAYV